MVVEIMETLLMRPVRSIGGQRGSEPRPRQRSCPAVEPLRLRPRAGRRRLLPGIRMPVMQVSPASSVGNSRAKQASPDAVPGSPSVVICSSSARNAFKALAALDRLQNRRPPAMRVHHGHCGRSQPITVPLRRAATRRRQRDLTGQAGGVSSCAIRAPHAGQRSGTFASGCARAVQRGPHRVTSADSARRTPAAERGPAAASGELRQGPGSLDVTAGAQETLGGKAHERGDHHGAET